MTPTAIILAGGRGTRLQSMVSDLPKPLAPVNGRPFIWWQLNRLARYGIRRVVISTGYLAAKFSALGSVPPLEISFSHEETAAGTGGGIRLALERIAEPSVLVLNGDSLFDIDLQQFITTHHHTGASASLALRRVPDASRYGTVRIEGGRITAFEEKKAIAAPGLINGGVYCIQTGDFLADTPAAQPFSIERDYFEKRCETRYFAGQEFDDYFIDIGIPADYLRAQDEFKRFAY